MLTNRKCSVAFALALICVFLPTLSAHAQAPCPGSESCTGLVAQLICPDPGSTLAGNDVTFTWCNANADYFLQMESIPGAHDIFFAFVPAQNFVHLINIPTNGATIYVTLWTKLHGAYQTPLNYTYTAANLLPLRLGSATLGTNGQFQFTISNLTPGKTNVVETSPNLADWSALTTNVAVGNSQPILDLGATNTARRFYRAFELR